MPFAASMYRGGEVSGSLTWWWPRQSACAFRYSASSHTLPYPGPHPGSRFTSTACPGSNALRFPTGLPLPLVRRAAGGRTDQA